MALLQAADQEPTLREMFHELADGIVHRAGKLLGNLRPIRLNGSINRVLNEGSQRLAVPMIAAASGRYECI
jgi:hypothetical protein